MKKCAVCAEIKSIDNYSVSKKNSNKYIRSKCIPCYKKYLSDWFQKNKKNHMKKAASRNRSQKVIVREFLKDLKSTLSCVDCGNSNPIVLDFDHVRGEKILPISQMLARALSIETIKKEIEKCDVRCANCHRIVTHERRKNKASIAQQDRAGTF